MEREVDDAMSSTQDLATEIASGLEYLGLDVELVGDGRLIVRGELASFKIAVDRIKDDEEIARSKPRSPSSGALES